MLWKIAYLHTPNNYRGSFRKSVELLVRTWPRQRTGEGDSGRFERVVADRELGVELSPREQTVLGLIGTGHSATEIARLLTISPQTVAKYTRRIYRKLGTDYQAEAVSRAISLGLLDQGPPWSASRIMLTPRERDVLDAIALGRTIRQTARALKVAEKTVENTRSRLYCKLGARNRSDALTIAHRLGLLH